MSWTLIETPWPDTRPCARNRDGCRVGKKLERENLRVRS